MKELIEKACHALRQADAILIGASNGLSIAEGYNIFADNEMFRSQFGSFRQRFGIQSVLDGCFHNYPSETDRHEFLSRLVEYWVKDYRPSQVMENLRAIIGDKPHFILTTNGDTHLELSGFDPACVWEIEGTFTHLLQGKQPDNKQDVVNSFLSRYTGKRLVVLELGIGSRNRIIKQPLMQLVEHEPNATYITLNLPHELYIPEEIAGKSIALPGDIAITLVEINNCMEGMHPHTETASTGKR
ncbi:MAG: hypothetical protein SO188_10055 [Prevotella sp.]|nr:hypothetical protein [Prevotella sp.]